jgi:hypothetical protein
MQKLLLVLIIISACAFSATAQDLQITSVQFKNNKVVLNYSLVDSIKTNRYTIRLYTSKDNFINPAERISGDHGLEVKPGPDNYIVWDAIAELGAGFNGSLSFELRARLFVPFISTESISQYKVFKRNRNYNITWTGGSPQNVLNFDLYKGERKVASFPNLANVGHYSLRFPNHISPGNDYRFRISDIKNKDEVVTTSVFKVRRQIPLLVKIVPLAVTGFVIYKLVGKRSSDDSLPDPPTSFKN